MSRPLSWLVGGLLVCGCGPGREATKPGDVSDKGKAVQPAAAETNAPASAQIPPPSASSTAGDDSNRTLGFRVASSSVKPLDIPSIGRLIVADQSEVIIDLEDGTRVAAAPHTRLCALAFAPSFMLISGQVHVTRLPDALRAGSVAARISTLSGALETSPGTQATLAIETQPPKLERAHAKRPEAGRLELRAQLQLERGSLTWLALELDEHSQRSQLQETQLSAGSAPPRPTTGLHWFAAAPAGLAFEAAFRKLPWQKQAPSEDVDRALEASLSEQQALRARGHELLASVSPHHAALAKLARDGSAQANAKPEAASTREYQRALVEHAQRSHAHAAQLLLAAERSLLQAFALCADTTISSCTALQAWSERFSARCASLL